MNFSNTLKSHLLSLIEEMASHPQDFTKNPKTDFSRTKNGLLKRLYYLCFPWKAIHLKTSF